MDMLRKTMTKKAYKNLQKSQRSVVSLGMNTGTREIVSNRYKRDEQIKRMIRLQNWD